MSEVNPGKRKEKCENCTKQVSSRLRISASEKLNVRNVTLLSSDQSIVLPQCNKRQSDDGANSQQEGDEVNGQVMFVTLPVMKTNVLNFFGAFILTFVLF